MILAVRFTVQYAGYVVVHILVHLAVAYVSVYTCRPTCRPICVRMSFISSRFYCYDTIRYDTIR